MAELTVMQINIKSWTNNWYILAVDLPNYNPDIILLNETSNVGNNIKLQGYHVIQSCVGMYTGVAILIKLSLKFTVLPTRDSHSLAIKLFTSLGPIIISTCYTPPRFDSVPTITLNKLLDYNLPTLIAGDFNARHVDFHNTGAARAIHYNNRGIQLAALSHNRSLHFMGPYFHTYESANKIGRAHV